MREITRVEINFYDQDNKIISSTASMLALDEYIFTEEPADFIASKAMHTFLSACRFVYTTIAKENESSNRWLQRSS